MRIILLRFIAIALLAVPDRTFADHTPIDVALKMSGPLLAAEGSEVTYTLTLTAVFPGAAYAVTDTLPPNARLVRAGGTLWNCLESNGKVTCGNERLDSFSSSLFVTVIAPPTPQVMTNVATVQSVSVFDPFPGNNTDSLATTVYDPVVCGTNSIDALSPP